MARHMGMLADFFCFFSCDWSKRSAREDNEKSSERRRKFGKLKPQKINEKCMFRRKEIELGGERV
jgi:hypothetical protein